jgi:hypothetical protein
MADFAGGGGVGLLFVDGGKTSRDHVVRAGTAYESMRCHWRPPSNQTPSSLLRIVVKELESATRRSLVWRMTTFRASARLNPLAPR